MKIDYPAQEQMGQLRRLWKAAFGDDEWFLDRFFNRVYSADRCRCITEKGEVVAALYWLDCRWEGKPLAYLYAVATERNYRGRGYCRALMADTHILLKRLGYTGSLLVPGNGELFRMYRGMGYVLCGGIQEFSCRAGETAVHLREIPVEEFARQRREYLPEGGIIQEGENLAFMRQLYRFYQGDDFLLCALRDGKRLKGMELLGNPERSPGILKALGAAEGTFRIPGREKPFAMYQSFTDGQIPQYFGIAFD